MMQVTIQRDRARSMRRFMTAAERCLWNALKGRKLDGFRFNRQAEIGFFIADFVCRQRMLIVEVDGATHLDDADVRRDAARTAWLRSQGYRVVRVTNEEVFDRLDVVLGRVKEALG